MAKILLEVRDNVLIASTEGVITSDTISVPCSISFSDEWAPYGKTIFFYQNPRKMHRVVVAGQSADFEVPPQAIITGGELHIGVFGNYTDGEGNPQRKVAVATSVPASKGSYNGTDLPKPSVSEYEQIISIMMAYADAREVAEIAKEAAEQIATDASTVRGYVDEASAHAETAQTAAAASASARDESLAAISDALSARDEVVEVAEEALNKMGGYNAKVEKNSKRATNAEDASTVKTPNSSVAYTKTVPANALPYAEITEIGGMTRKCENLFDFNTWKVMAATMNGTSSFGDNSVTLHATSGDAYVMAASQVPVKGGETYTISFDESDTDISTVHYLFKNGAIDASMKQYYSSPFTFTADADATFYTVRFGVSYAGDTVTFANIMFNRGGTALPYEPFFEGLRSALVTAVDSVGVNLYSGGDLNFVGYKEIALDKPLPAGTYTLTAHATSTDTDATYNLITFFQDANGKPNVYGSLKRGTRNSTTVTLEVPVSAIRFGASDNISHGEGDTATFTDIMLNKGSTALPYAPYFKRTLDIPEAVRAKNGINENVYDYTDLAEGKNYVRVGMKDAGTLKWTVWDSNGDGVADRAYSDRFAKPNGSVIASALPVGSRDVYIDAYGAICAYITDGGYTSEAFKAAMSGVMLCYELAEPIITDISDILPADNFIQVEEGGTVTMVNEYEYDVPSTVVYRVPKVGDNYVMISSPNGTMYKLTVSDSGSVSAVKT